jgi:thiamine biosynthesis lipoprotein
MYQANKPLHEGIKAALNQVNSSLSTFDSTSIISRINQNDTTVVADSLFALVFNTAQQVSAQTHGAFDITVAPLVNAWGFGFDPTRNRTQATIDSLKACVGYQKIALQNGKITKTVPCVQLDASAIAKGLGCDVVAQYLQREGVQNYLVDIGGEMVLSGNNPQGGRWRVGIQQPKEDSLLVSNQIAAILQASEVGIATSGNYRQFYYQGGQKISHTIDPRTATSTQHNLLSTTVVAPSAMLADAYATAFMVLGDKDSIEAIAHAQRLGVYLLYAVQDSIQASYNELFETYLLP